MDILDVDQEINKRIALAAKLTREADALLKKAVSKIIAEFEMKPITGNIHVDVENYRGMIATIGSQVDNTVNKNSFLFDLSLSIKDMLEAKWIEYEKYATEDRHIDISTSPTDFSDEDGIIQHNLHELLFEGAEMIGRGKPVLKTPTGKELYVSNIAISVNKASNYMSSLTLYSKIRSDLDKIQDIEGSNIDKIIKMSIIKKSLQYPDSRIFGFDVGTVYYRMAKEKRKDPFGAYGKMSILPDSNPIVRPIGRKAIDEVFKAVLLKKVDIEQIAFRYVGSNRIAFVQIDKKIEVVL